MKKYIVITLFLTVSAFCNAQNYGANPFLDLAALPVHSIQQHCDWILDSYTNILHLSDSQKIALNQAILSAYKGVPNSDLYDKAKDNISLLQGMELHAQIEDKFKEILNPEQYSQFIQMKPRPEDCFSLSKDYNLYWCSNPAYK